MALAHCDICGKYVPGNMKGKPYKHNCAERAALDASEQTIREQCARIAEAEACQGICLHDGCAMAKVIAAAIRSGK